MEKIKCLSSLFAILLASLICASADENVQFRRRIVNSTTSSSITLAPKRIRSTSTTTIKPVAELASASILSQSTVPLNKVDNPETLSDFIVTMMKKFGAAKAAEAFESLDQLPLGLIMKILLVEMDKQLSADIVQMQRYAQSSDKTLIQMIGRIVAGDKTVPKEIFAMDQKLMKFPWWMRIRQRMFNNLEKYVAAYSLVPVAVKTAVNGAAPASSGRASSKSSGLESIVEGPKSDLTAAVVASATEAYSTPAPKVVQVPAAPVQEIKASASAPVPVASSPLRISLLNPIQQQQILETLALAQAAANANAQAQQLLQLQQLQNQQSQSQTNPFFG